MRLVPAAPVIVVDRFLRVVIVNPQVFGDFAVQRLEDLLPISLDQERLPIPTVEGAVVLSLTDHPKDDVGLEEVASTHPVVVVHSSAGAVEANIIAKGRQLGLRMEVARHLLLEVTNLMEQVSLNHGVLRVVAIRGVWPLRWRDWHLALGVWVVGGIPPAHDAVLAHEVKLVVRNRGVAAIPREHHTVAIDPLKEARVDCYTFGTADVDSGAPCYCPVPASVRRQPVGRQGTECGVRELHSPDRNVSGVGSSLTAGAPGACDGDQFLELGSCQYEITGWCACPVVEEVEVTHFRVEIVLVWRVELLKGVLDVPLGGSGAPFTTLKSTPGPREGVGSRVVRVRQENI
mmetsp:Transcript_34797/g.91098  ORF Transcript_34797/g.91098 Transcript_34797/m.91098 type:complete len:346 (-) Transcript_34797:1385-2422(-)